jgi:NAD-dependent dihydropyrimidine dehydrogenase PreA subunit
MHARVRLAERIWQEDAGDVEGTTDASDAFRATGRRTEDLYDEVRGIVGRFGVGGRAFGAFVGLAIAGRLIGLSVRRRRVDYEADRAACLACGRCFLYCPVERERLKKRQTGAAHG